MGKNRRSFASIISELKVSKKKGPRRLGTCGNGLIGCGFYPRAPCMFCGSPAPPPSWGAPFCLVQGDVNCRSTPLTSISCCGDHSHLHWASVQPAGSISKLHKLLSGESLWLKTPSNGISHALFLIFRSFPHNEREISHLSFIIGSVNKNSLE